MKILFLSHTPLSSQFVVGSHHLVREFKKLGHEVRHVSIPVSLVDFLLKKNQVSSINKRGTFSNNRKTEYSEQIDIVPFNLLPWSIWCKLPFGINFSIKMASAFSFFLEFKKEHFDIVFMDEPSLLPILTKIKYDKLVYRPTDIYSEMFPERKLDLLEDKILRLADKVVATSNPVAKYYSNIYQGEVLCVENGVNLELFTTKPFNVPDVIIPEGMNVVYVGALDYRFGFDILNHVAADHPSINFLLLGPVEENIKKSFSHLTNVYFYGSIAQQFLPYFFSKSDFGILPLSDHPANAGRSPMKLYEYASLGLPVISSFTDELSHRNLPFVFLSKNKEEFSGHINKLKVTDLSSVSNVAHEIALEQDWVAKAKLIIEYALSA